VGAGVAHWDEDGSVVFDVVQRQDVAGADERPPPEPSAESAPPAPPAPASTSPTAAAGTAAAAATTAAAAAAAPGGLPLDELARRLFDPLAARLKAELRLDRERAGLLTDLRR